MEFEFIASEGLPGASLRFTSPPLTVRVHGFPAIACDQEGNASIFNPCTFSVLAAEK
jgi:hypothetical protein